MLELTENKKTNIKPFTNKHLTLENNYHEVHNVTVKQFLQVHYYPCNVASFSSLGSCSVLVCGEKHVKRRMGNMRSATEFLHICSVNTCTKMK